MATTVADTASGPIMPVSSVLMPSMMVMPQRYGKKEREAFKDCPRAALDDGPKSVPRGSVYGEIADDVRSRCESGDADHEA